MFDVLGAPDTSSSKRTRSFVPSRAHCLNNSCMPEAQHSFDNISNAVKAQSWFFWGWVSFQTSLEGTLNENFPIQDLQAVLGLPCSSSWVMPFLSPKLLKIVTWLIVHLLVCAPRTGIPYAGHMSGLCCANFLWKMLLNCLTCRTSSSPIHPTIQLGSHTLTYCYGLWLTQISFVLLLKHSVTSDWLKSWIQMPHGRQIPWTQILLCMCVFPIIRISVRNRAFLNRETHSLQPHRFFTGYWDNERDGFCDLNQRKVIQFSSPVEICTEIEDHQLLKRGRNINQDIRYSEAMRKNPNQCQINTVCDSFKKYYFYRTPQSKNHAA